MVREFLLRHEGSGVILRAPDSAMEGSRSRGDDSATATASVHDDVIVRFSCLVSACPMEALSTWHRKISTDPEGGEA